jgi:hemolysin activation/secretion protein
MRHTQKNRKRPWFLSTFINNWGHQNGNRYITSVTITHNNPTLILCHESLVKIQMDHSTRTKVIAQKLSCGNVALISYHP